MASALSPGGYVRQGARNASAPRSVNVQVAVRCRPLNERERTAGDRPVILCSPDRREVTCLAPAAQRKGASAATVANAKKLFTYDNVFGPEASQADVYNQLVEPIVDEVLQGYNCTVFAYGQTGTGKTHTMEGRRDDDIIEMSDRRLPENAGIIPRAVKQVFDHLRSITDEHSVRVSHLELYNEQLTDLLSPHDVVGEALRMYEDPHKGTFVQGLEDVVVRSEEEIFAVLDHSATKRRTEETLMNKYSSRSHSVFSITIHIKESTPEGADLLKVGKLNLVDLAGSENVGRSGAVKGRAREAGNINQSLLTLGRVITALVDRHPHIPYRDSKLTRLLQESLGGRNKTCVIATVTPGSGSVEETASTLDYAYRAKSIKNRPTVNQMIAKHVLLKEYTEEISKLKRELDATRTKNGVYMTKEDFDKLKVTSTHQTEWISHLEERTEEFEKKTASLKEKLGRTQEALARDRQELSDTKQTLTDVKDELDSTKNTLTIVRQQKDENAHLVTSHVVTEEKLREEGTELQETVSECLSDIGALQTRVSAKAAIEKENIESMKSLQGTVERGVSDLCESIETNERHQAEILQQSRLKLDEIVSGVESGLSSIVKRMEEFRKEFEMADRENSKSTSEFVSAFCDAATGNVRSVEGVLSERTAAVIDKASDVSSLCGSMNALFTELEEGIAATRSTLGEHTSQQKELISRFIVSQKEVSRQLTGDIKQRLRNQEKHLHDMKEEIAKDLEHQKETLEATKSQAIEQVRAALDMLVSKNVDAIASTNAMTKNKLSQADSDSRALAETLDEHAKSLEMNCESLLSDSDSSATRLDTSFRETELVLVDAIRNGREASDTQSSLATSIQTTCVDAKSDALAQLTGLRDSVIAFKDDSEKRQAAETAENTVRFTNECSLASDLSSSVRDGVSVGRTALVEQLELNEEAVNRHADSSKRDLQNSVREPVSTHQVVTDVSHSSAPPVRVWMYPQELTRTDPHNNIIAEFRAKRGYPVVSLEDFGQVIPVELRQQQNHEEEIVRREENKEASEQRTEVSSECGAGNFEVVDAGLGIADNGSSDGHIEEEHCDEGTENSLSSVSEDQAELCDENSVLTDSTNRRQTNRPNRPTAMVTQKKRSGIPAPRRKRPSSRKVVK